MSVRRGNLLWVDIMKFSRASLAVWIEQKDPFMASYCETLRCNRLSVPKSFNEAVSYYCVFMFTCRKNTTC
jgi:hypothetical protein